MHPLAIIEHLYVFKQLGSRFFSGREASIILQLAFECLEKALHHRIVPTVASTAHAHLDVILPQLGLQKMALILAPLIGMMN